MAAPTTYSFKSITAVLSHPLVPDVVFTGNIGIGQISVKNSTERTATETAADGGIMMSRIEGASGGADIEVQQTSVIQSLLIAWFNVLVAADPSYWTQSTLLVRDKLTGAGHILTGVAPTKIPDKVYAAQGGKITWNLVAGNVQNV